MDVDVEAQKSTGQGRRRKRFDILSCRRVASLESILHIHPGPFFPFFILFLHIQNQPHVIRIRLAELPAHRPSLLNSQIHTIPYE